MIDSLHVLLGEELVGTVTRTGGGTLRFDYADDYREREGVTPLSLSMPLTSTSFTDGVIRAWLWGLLPDNAEVLQRWSRTFQVSLGSPFGLLTTPIGEDCAGAVRTVVPDRLEATLGRHGDVTWLDEADVAERLRTLRADATAWLGGDTSGRFSLAGAQAKTALLLHDGRWGLPSGASATSHILKPAIVGLDDHDVNEHLCLRAAQLCSLPAVNSSILRFEDEKAVVIERYDRIPDPRHPDALDLLRLHQEDACQALAVPPEKKYQADGGPTSNTISRLLRRVMPAAVGDEDVGRFTDALIFNWLIGGTDAHAKNYALLLSGSRVRLAPLYDIGSALPYPGMHVRKLKLAMKFGGDYSLLTRDAKVWARLATEVGLSPAQVLDRARDLVQRTPDAFAQAASDPAVKELGSDLPARLVDAVAARVAVCAGALP